MTRCCNYKNRGFTLTEAAIVLGIIGLVFGAIWTAALSVNETRRTNKALNDFIMITSNIKELYKGTSAMSNTSNFTTANMVKAGVFPDDILSNNLPFTPWNTSITLRAPNNTSFSLTYTDLSVTNCRNLVGRMAGTNHNPSLISILASGTTFTGNALDTLGAASPSLNNCTSATFTFSLK